MSRIIIDSSEDEDGNAVVDKTFESDLDIISAIRAINDLTFDRKANRRYTTLRKSECFDELCAAVDAYHAAHKAWISCFGGKREKRAWGIEP